ncbi:MAG: VOC family protein [Candidatus Hodarchaeales archaeon]|jgi:predicted enzyme related to lactoylglutathione lyase
MQKKFPFKTDSIYFQYSVKDITRAKEFYTKIFGFKITWDGGTDVGWCELQLPVTGAKLGLNLLSPDTELISGSGVLTFDVTDLELTKSLLDSKNVKTSEIIDVPKMVSYFNATDSEGNKIQFVCEPRKD